MPSLQTTRRPRVVVLWIDWYPYHVARFRGLASAPALRGGVIGIEMVGGVGVHKGLKFREELPKDLAVETFARAGRSVTVHRGSSADLGRPAPRPAYSVLGSTRSDAPVLPSWQEGLQAHLTLREVLAS